jgi:hypothetical protein
MWTVKKNRKMKQKILIIIAGAAITSSCTQLNNSIRETFHPDSSRMVVKDRSVTQSSVQRSTTTESHVFRDTVIETSAMSVQISPSSINVQLKREPGILKDAATLSAAEQALRSLPAFKGKTINFYQHVHFYNDGRIIARVQNPDNAEYVDEYTYQNGKWMEPVPVQLSVRENIKKNLVSLDAVRFASVADIYKNYTEKAADIQGAPALTHVYFFVLNNAFEWYPQRINGSRERYHISFRRDGSVDRFYRE